MILFRIIKKCNYKISLRQSEKLKELSKRGEWSRNRAVEIICEDSEKSHRIVIDHEKIKDYFPEDVSDEKIEQTIFELLENWKIQGYRYDYIKRI